MKITAKITKLVTENAKGAIYGAIPVSDCDKIILHPKYKNFTLLSKNLTLKEGSTYELEVTEVNGNYGIQYQIDSIPSLDNLDINNLTFDQSLNILSVNTSDKLAKELLKHYPNIIQLFMTDKIDEIDVKKLYGIKDIRLAQIMENTKDSLKWYEIIHKCKKFELTIKECGLLSKLYDNVDTIEKNLNERPYYNLINICGRGFENTDGLVAELFPEMRESDDRKVYAIFWRLGKNENDGNTKIDFDELKDQIEYYDNLLLGNIEEVIKFNSDLFYLSDNKEWISILSTYLAEKNIFNFIKDKLNNSKKLDIDYSKYCEVDGFKLSEMQSLSVKNLCEYNFSLLLGFAGAGKTTCLRSMISAMEDNGLSYRIVCPTAKASLRVTQVTKRKAQTIHRLVLSEKELNYDVILMDESSMVDLPTFTMLLNSITNENCRIILIGDNAQLLSVGLSNIFNDIIKSQKVPTTMLTEVFRYSDKGVAYVATNIRQGKKFLDGYETQLLSSKYKFIQTDEIVDTLLGEYQKLLNKGVKIDDILCLSPMRVGEEGCFNINSAIQNIVNPLKGKDKQISTKMNIRGINYVTNFRINDIVICKKNDYSAILYDEYLKIKENETNYGIKEELKGSCSIFNGQSGKIRNIVDDGLVIQFDEELIYYSKSNLKNIMLFYIGTCHSAQGSESPYVISITSPLHLRMLNRQLCYVSSTRASNSHIEIGDINTMNKALTIDSVILRKTWLYDMLIESEKII